MVTDFIDVRRAYFHARARRDVFVELPDEDSEPGMCGKLIKSLYGTRDAAQNWEEEYIGFMRDIGFDSGRASPCLFHHADREIRAVVHGDDFTLLGHRDDLDWFKKTMETKFDIKHKRMGAGLNDEKSVRILNRVVTYTSDGIEWEAAPK